MAEQQTLPILIVDDYKTTLRIMRALLKQLGFDHIEEATCADDALLMLRENSYGLVLCDWNMEPRSGYELLCEMRAEAPLKETPFVMIIAASNTVQITAAQTAGANGHIIKPFKASSLKIKLTEVLGAF